jgi:hypothetical protein
MQSDESATSRLYNILRERLLFNNYVSFSLSSCGTGGTDSELVLTGLRSHDNLSSLLSDNEASLAERHSEDSTD